MDLLKPLALALAIATAASAASAHITVWPRQSQQGARERYVIRVPNEKRVPTVRVEVRFPGGGRVTAFEQKPGWRIEPTRDPGGAIVGAAWTGSLPPDQFVEFGVLAQNGKAATALTWSFTQVYADGTTVEWSGPKGSRTPAPQVELRPRP